MDVGFRLYMVGCRIVLVIYFLYLLLWKHDLLLVVRRFYFVMFLLPLMSSSSPVTYRSEYILPWVTLRTKYTTSK